MKNLTTKKIVLTIATTLAVGIAANAMAKNTPEEDAIKYRQGAFTMIGHHFGPMAAMVKGKMEFDAEAFTKNAEAVAALSQFPIHGFIEGSYEGETDAKKEIAENMDDFTEKMETFKIEAANLAKVAADGGDLAALKPAFGKVGQSCKACHTDYREKN
ncbi:MAG: putative c'cytochrome [uncultured Thiotrichaceae bacterium]|uniref:Putative c'cytochrome n=1 Tax=uncultured Thiotrichaceae bacterium TaxID=298394 RepID=A0A6S6U8F8_9GAMM|nr:MAG: putative c'cytochrome [uncultured Thiotrichaceae bacterium]